MSEKLKQTEDTLRDLIETLRDGHQGFIELEKNLKDPEARQLFREQTLERAEFAAELENELHHFGVKDVKVASSTAGKVHRAWVKTRPSMLMKKRWRAKIFPSRCGRYSCGSSGISWRRMTA